MVKSQNVPFRKLALLLLLMVLSLLLTLSCRTVPSPQPLPDASEIREDEKSAVYDEYKLTKKGSLFWGTYFLQGADSQKYPYGKIQPLFDHSSEDALSAYKRGSGFALTSLISAGAGGALLGYPLGGYIATGELTDADHLFIGAGAGFVFFSFITSKIADNALQTGVNEYNLFLAQQY